jgi:hypothetical protein
MEETFSAQSVPRFYNQNQLAVAVSHKERLGFSRFELLLLEAGAEAGDNSGTQRKVNVHR